MKHNLTEYYNELIEITRQNINQAEAFRQMDEERLNQKPSPESWSVLECIEHLNRYSDFYHPEIEKTLKATSSSKATHFKSGWLGAYFAENMKPSPTMKKMNTFKDKNPSGSQLSTEVLDTFIHQQKTLLQLLDNSRGKNLNRRNKITLPLLTFKLGDTFRFVIFHNQRHIEQAKRVEELP